MIKEKSGSTADRKHHEQAETERRALNQRIDDQLGLGLRSTHFSHILNENPNVSWFEIISENFMDSGGRPRHMLNQIAERYPIVMHGVSLSIGSVDELDYGYLTRLKSLASEVNAKWVSDHLCWTGVMTLNSHDLLPMPMTEESLKHVCERIEKVQDFLGRPLVLENPSTYMQYKQSDISEWEFFNEMFSRTGCKMLLDVNNVYVSCFNSQTNPHEYLEKINFKHVRQMHLAGHEHCGDYIVDTHDRPVSEEVWPLFEYAWNRTEGVATCLEWDGNIPSFDAYLNELLKAKEVLLKSKVDSDTIGNDHSLSSVYDTNKHSIATPLDFLVPSMGD
ncbi:DUF692 domain-containing protein [Marinomonas mediterranea]|uniref:MNIO family bufferin maturase n=1 Tax=Marinomonas mediterranea TaxID=119864 RepID=UPI0023493A0F|nr:DUF692 domain-containing protein [Marinomonas mediterranea]WCN09315.1 DUF692 family protein [Marinomonas mediterranea]WCN13397.1 DUF692 family protein [Marinomonas mediterranea]